jgi:hypothetical protein
LFILNQFCKNNSISLAIVIGLHDIYSSLKSDSFFSSHKKLIRFLFNHSLGGSTITAHKSFIFSFKFGLVLKAFSLGDAKKKQLFSSQFILALYCASIIASSTISIQTKSDQIQFFNRLIHIVQVQQ